jgi:glycosyltransferase involved in cell wall biosynthesis
MPTRIRVCAVLTHPVQYYAPWFRWIHAHSPAIDLHVVYGSAPTARQQGAGFDRDFSWDVPVTEGYASTVVRAAQRSDRFDSEHFWGLDVPEIGDAIRDARPDVVVVFGWYSVTLVRAIRAARRLHVPVLYHGDTNLQSAPDGWRRLLWIAKTRRLLAQFDGYLSVGVRAAAFLRYFGIDDGRIFKTPHSVDNERFAEAARWRSEPDRRAEIRSALGLPAEAFVVLFAGKLEAKKHPLDLVHALGAMSPRPHLAIAGAGPLESDVRQAADRLGVSVSWLGFVNQSQMTRVYAAADCLALPSDGRETWGLVVNEALAAGLPCVVSDLVGCAPDLGGSATGGVYATAEPTDVVNYLAAALSDVRDRLAAGHDFAPACRERAAARSFARASAGLERACLTVAAAPRGAAAPVAVADAPRVVACCGGMVLVGGLERMTFEVLSVLGDGGATIHCVVNGWDNSRVIAVAERLGASWSTGFYWHLFTRRTRSPIVIARIVWDMVRTSAGLLRDAWGFRATHVFLSDHISTLRNVPALWLLRLAGKRVVLRLGNAPDEGRFYRWVWRLGISPAVDRFVCNSSYTERALAAHGIPAAKRTTIPHTPPTRHLVSSRAREPRDCRRVIYIGQIIPEKGVDLLLDAVGLLVARGRDVRLDIAGRMDGWVPPEHRGYRERLIARAEAEDLNGRVRFLGFREDVPQLLAAAAIHCCPSRKEQREAFGIVVIEAKQAGIPSVVTPSGALADLIAHGDNGWVCREESAEALAEGIDYFLDADRLRHAMAAARASAATYSRDRFEDAWRGVFSVAGSIPRQVAL